MLFNAERSGCSLEALFSLDALRRAWRLVRKNGQSPGIDKITPLYFARQLEVELNALQSELISGRYQPRPVIRFYQLKPSGKKRPLTIWAVRDRVAQRVVLDLLTPQLEAVFLDCSYGFRPGRRIMDAITAVHQAFATHLFWVVDADIAECFDSIPTHLMQAQAEAFISQAPVLTLIRQWLNTPIAGQPGKCAGVSQGGIISPLLTNLYLHRFDQIVTAALPATRLVRFADDFLILCRRKQEAHEALQICQRTLSILKMRVNEAKTRVLHADEGFSFLGTQFQPRKRPSSQRVPNDEEEDNGRRLRP